MAVDLCWGDVDPNDPQTPNRLLTQARGLVHDPYDKCSGRAWYEYIAQRTRLLWCARCLGIEAVMRGVLSVGWRKPPSGHGACGDLRRADMAGVDLRRGDFLSSDLGRANMRGADLREALMRHALMTATDLEGANLAGADMEACRGSVPSPWSDARLILRGANLRGAHMAYAQLEGADLRRADLSGANLCCADMTRARVTEALFTGAKVSPKTKLPKRMSKCQRALLVRLDKDPALTVVGR